MKLEQKIANDVHALLEREYNLSIKPSAAIGIARCSLNHQKQNQNSAFYRKSKHFIDAIYAAYFDSIKLPEKEYTKHSAFWFAQFVKRHYVLIPIKNNRLNRKIAHWLRKLF